MDKYQVNFVTSENQLQNYYNSIVISSLLQEENINLYLKNGNLVINISQNSFEARTGLAEGLYISQNNYSNLIPGFQMTSAWMKIIIIDDQIMNMDFSTLKGVSDVDWIILKTRSSDLGDYILQAWKYGLKLWAEKYPLSQQEMPEKALIYLGSR